MAGNVFVSYRRDDSKAEAGRIYDHLAKHYGRRKIFMDVDTIEPGSDFFDVLERAVSECSVLVAVIGPSWLNAQNSEGKRRLDDPEDLVRAEIAAALKRNIRVVPVLVDGASMPKSSDLPSDVMAITRRHAISITHERFASDAEALVQTIKKTSSGTRSNVMARSALALTVVSGLAAATMYWSEPIFQILERFKFTARPIQTVTVPTHVLLGEQKRSLEEGGTSTFPTLALSKEPKGLARIQLHHESIVLYATASGSVSMDGDKNSPFAAAISDALKNGITDVELIAKRVVANVRVISNDLQSPVYESNLTRSINLADKQLEKIALIIGNAAYSHTTQLLNPARDAEILARQLGHLDFETILALDAGREQMLKTIQRFVRRLKAAPKNTIAIVYYGGHAIQIDGGNYIMPIDVRAENAAEVKQQATSIQDIVEAMRSADIIASIIMLDACRDDPFKRSFTR